MPRHQDRAETRCRAGAFLRALVALPILFLAAMPSARAASDGRKYYYDHVNVSVDVLPDGTMEIAETLGLAFTSGRFAYSYRWIPTDMTEGIYDIRVIEEGIEYDYDPSVADWIELRRDGKAARAARQAYAVEEKRGRVWIAWWFDETENRSRTFEIKYKVRGGLRIRDGEAEVYWAPVFKDREVPVTASTTVVRLPEEAPAGSIKAATYGVPASARVIDARTLEFTTGRIPRRKDLRIRVAFPREMVSSVAPAWQAEAERREAYDEKRRPHINLALAIVGLLVVPVVGIVWLKRVAEARGPVPRVGPHASAVVSPPSEAAPALVSLVIDGRLGAHAHEATVFDMARKGMIEIREIKQTRVFGIKTRDVVITKKPDVPGLEFEQTIADAVSGAPLSKRRREVLRVLRKFPGQVEQESVRAGLFAEEPSKSRRRLLVPAAILLVAALAVGIPATALLFSRAELIFVPFLAATGVAIAAVFVAEGLPVRTVEGARQSALWKLFRRHLKKVARSAEMARKSLDLWDAHLPYAVLFGLKKPWIGVYSRAGAAAPIWFVPATGGGGAPAGASLSSLGSGSLAGVGEAISGAFSSISAAVGGGGAGGGGGGAGGGGAG